MDLRDASLIWFLDLLLVAVLSILSAIIVSYGLWKKADVIRVSRRLAAIKTRIYEFFLSEGKTEAMPVKRFTAGDFLDIVKNRNKDLVFFNQSEQEYFKHCFITHEKILELQRVAEKSPLKWKRIEAILALGYTGAASALGIFEKCLFDRDEDVSYFAMLALGQVKTDLSARILISFLKKNKLKMQKVVSLLENFPPAIGEEITPLTADKDPEIRLWAVQISTRLHAMIRKDAIGILAGDPSELVRAAICEYLAACPPENASGILIRALGDDFWFVRLSASKSLSALLGGGAAEFLTPLLKDNSWNVVENIKDILGRDIQAAKPFLEKMLLENDELARKNASEVLSMAGHFKISGGPR